MPDAKRAYPVLREAPDWETIVSLDHGHGDDGGFHAEAMFLNGFGFSLIRFTSPSGFGGSYGHEQGLYELAALHGNDEGEVGLCYPVGIGDDDVVGWLTPEDATLLIADIFALSADAPFRPPPTLEETMAQLRQAIDDLTIW